MATYTPAANMDDNEQVMNQFNQNLRADPLYQEFLKSIGADPSRPLKLSDDQRKKADGWIRENIGDIEHLQVDPAGNVNQDEGWSKHKKWAIPVIIGASMLIPGVGPAVWAAMQAAGGGIGAGLGLGSAGAGAGAAGAAGAGAAGTLGAGSGLAGLAASGGMAGAAGMGSTLGAATGLGLGGMSGGLAALGGGAALAGGAIPLATSASTGLSGLGAGLGGTTAGAGGAGGTLAGSSIPLASSSSTSMGGLGGGLTGGAGGAGGGGGGVANALGQVSKYKKYADIVNQGAKAMGSAADAEAQNRGARMGADYDAELLSQAALRDYNDSVVAREQEGRTGLKDAWNAQLRGDYIANRGDFKAPSYLAGMTDFSFTPKASTEAQKQAAAAMSAEAMARLQGGNPIAPIQKPKPFEFDPNDVNPGKMEKASPWIGAGMSALGAYFGR